MKELFKLLNSLEWEHVALRFGPHEGDERFIVRIAPHALSVEHWHAARALAERIAAMEDPPCFSVVGMKTTL